MKYKEEKEVKAPSFSSSSSSLCCFSFQSLVTTKATYKEIARDFHRYHRNDVNVALHLLTTTLGIWGAVQLVLLLSGGGKVVGVAAVMTYAVWILATVPLLPTALLHTVVLYILCLVTPAPLPLHIHGQELAVYWTCLAAIVAGYGLQDLAHYLCQEPTYMNSYIATQPLLLVAHSVYLLPLVLDAVNSRCWFLPMIVPRNRNISTTVASSSRHAVDQIRNWILQNIPSVPETTHVWPHKQEGGTVDKATLTLEQDAAILQAFRTVFSSQHYDIRPVQDMNEIYVTAVGSKKDGVVNSDAVFYTPHTDGPYWFLPGASLYRVLVGLTPNQMVRTRFNLQHDDNNSSPSLQQQQQQQQSQQSQVVDMYGVLGFDYNRELHWIDHVPNVQNTERRSLMKLHYIVYPRGWHRYGKFCAKLNTNYNTWARGNFLQTLRPSSLYDHVLAWWIWLTTWFNAIWVEYVGWSNLVYIAAAYYYFCLLSSSSLLLFEIVTSFRHYVLYMTTFHFRQPMVAHGVLMRDAKLYKTIAMMHLGRRVLPLVSLPHDVPGVLLAALGFAVTLAATARLGMVRTYFGAELGFCKPKWIDGFPYGTIPHPMIVGQLFAFAAILVWFGNRLSTETIAIIGAHMTCYTVHMIQEMLSSSY